MSNVFLSRSLIKLAENEALQSCEDEGIVADDCELTVYGFRPSSLVTNIAVIAGLLAAFLLPIVGAIVDYTDHRKLVGGISAALFESHQPLSLTHH